MVVTAIVMPDAISAKCQSRSMRAVEPSCSWRNEPEIGAERLTKTTIGSDELALIDVPIFDGADIDEVLG